MVEDNRIELLRKPCKGPRLPLHQSPICSAFLGGNYSISDLWSHHTYLPPASRQEPLSHCQRPFGSKTTTRGYHTTSHRAGRTICWLDRTFWWRILGSNQSWPKSEDLQSPATPLRRILHNMVHDTRIELVFPPWKGSVLTDRRIVHEKKNPEAIQLSNRTGPCCWCPMTESNCRNLITKQV